MQFIYHHLEDNSWYSLMTNVIHIFIRKWFTFMSSDLILCDPSPMAQWLSNPAGS